MVIKRLILFIVVVALVGAAVYFFLQLRPFIQNTSQPNQQNATTTQATSSDIQTKNSEPAVTVVATGLTVPWDVAFLPDETMLVTERIGNLVHINKDGTKKTIKLPRTVLRGEGGLLGITLHPDFEINKFIYLYMTTRMEGTETRNAVFRYQFENDTVTNEQIIIQNIPGALYHDGGRLEFGPDGLLYITTGDAQTSAIAQNKNSLGGKILRIHDDGSTPADNPYNTAVYSYGHRNPQGLAWDGAGRLWETEHGRSGAVTGMDEINLIEAGKNYGWPTIEGDKTRPDMIGPALHSGANETWAPASLLFYKGKLYFGGLRGETLYEAELDGAKVTKLNRYFTGEFGRIRTIRLGPDGMFYLTTSNRDDRGKPGPDDDRIIKINPEKLR